VIGKKEMKMKSRLWHVMGVLILGVSLVVFSGCASTPHPRFYTLSSLDTGNPEAKPSADSRCLSIGVGPIGIPDYLDRPQIVTRTTPNVVSLAEFDRWSEPLKDNITRVLEKNLSQSLCAKTIFIFPWKGGAPLDYRIELQVLRLDGALGGNVFLEVWWMIYSGDGKKMLLSKKSMLTEATGGKDYQSFVGAQSQALLRLSNEIAEAVRKLSKES
jgi:uncharacterized lipoprotein YmbA